MTNVTFGLSSRGNKFEQVYHHYPAMAPFYFEFEKNFQAHPSWLGPSKDYPMLPVLIVVAYMAFCFFGSKVMEKRERFNLRYPLAYWNLLLCVFSTCGMVRTVPHILHLLSSKSFEYTVCTAADIQYGNGGSGLWVGLFIYSKIPELCDTIFIVLRKRQLIFLHWYHHVTVLLYCWHAYMTESSAGLYFVSMNYTVHAVMYGYYFLMALRIPPPVPPVLITILQILQMLVGTAICYASYRFYASGVSCGVTYENLVAGALMYASYLFLFMEFAVKRFILKDKSAKAE